LFAVFYGVCGPTALHLLASPNMLDTVKASPKDAPSSNVLDLKSILGVGKTMSSGIFRWRYLAWAVVAALAEKSCRIRILIGYGKRTIGFHLAVSAYACDKTCLTKYRLVRYS